MRGPTLPMMSKQPFRSPLFAWAFGALRPAVTFSGCNPWKVGHDGERDQEEQDPPGSSSEQRQRAASSGVASASGQLSHRIVPVASS